MRLPIRQIVILLSLIVTGGILLSVFFLKDSFLGKKSDLADNDTSSPGLISLLPQINSEGPVTVKVSPRDFSQPATSWDFEILLDTHSQNLEDPGLTNNSVLLDDKGNQLSPIYWEDIPADEVEPPQEHHRQGVLKFKPISPRPKSIELRINRVGDVSGRSFKWELR